MLLNFTPVIQQNCHQPGRNFEKSFCAVDSRGWQVELSKSETSQFRSDLVFDRKLCACNHLTWGLNVVLRYLKSSDFCVSEILWASNVPESSRCWQHHLVDSHFARHAMWFICIDILKNCQLWVLKYTTIHHFQVGPDIKLDLWSHIIYEVRDLFPWEMFTKMVISFLLNVEKIWNSAQINLSSTLNFYRRYVFDATISTEKSTSEIDADLVQNDM